jgi:hypothetical protein
MSVSQILNSNGKIPSSLVDGGGSGPATIPPLVSVLTVGPDAGNLFIDNLGGIQISDGAGTPKIIQETSLLGGGNSIPNPTVKIPYLDLTDSLSGNVGISTSEGAFDYLACVSGLYLGPSSADIKLTTIAGLDPTGAPMETLQIMNWGGGSAQIDCAAAQIGNLLIQSSQNQIYFTKSLDSTTVGAAAGRLPIVLGSNTFFLQVFNA